MSKQNSEPPLPWTLSRCLHPLMTLTTPPNPPTHTHSHIGEREQLSKPCTPSYLDQYTPTAWCSLVRWASVLRASGHTLSLLYVTFHLKSVGVYVAVKLCCTDLYNVGTYILIPPMLHFKGPLYLIMQLHPMTNVSNVSWYFFLLNVPYKEWIIYRWCKWMSYECNKLTIIVSCELASSLVQEVIVS